MAKTVHFAIGYAHYQTDIGNEILLHLDLIADMRDGGEIYFDDILIQKNGVFVVDKLKGLNFDVPKKTELKVKLLSK